MRRTIGTMAAVMMLAVGGCMTADIAPSATVTTLMPDTERNFRVSWDVSPEKDGLRRLSGWVENTYGEPAGRIQLLGQALDASGALVGQRLWWMPVAIPGFGRAYYEIPNMPVADNYRVTVWAYERIQGRDGGMVIR